MENLISVPNKSIRIVPNGVTSHFIASSFVIGCNVGCHYCYMNYIGPKQTKISSNIREIMISIENHSKVPKHLTEKNNVIDSRYIVYDIGMSTDLGKNWDKYPIEQVLKFFTDTKNIKSSFNTKFVTPNMLKYKASKKNRICIELSPTNIRGILEPNTPYIEARLASIPVLIDNGWDVVLSFSPIVITPTWRKDYENLFLTINDMFSSKYKKELKGRFTLLKHTKKRHRGNMIKSKESMLAENLLYNHKQQLKEKDGRITYAMKSLLYDDLSKIHMKTIPWLPILTKN